MTVLPSEKAPDDEPKKSYVRFTGMKTSGEFAKLPQIGERWRFEVLAECVKEPHNERMADGHLRPVVGMQVLEVTPGDIEEAPEDPQRTFDFDETDRPIVPAADKVDDPDGDA